MRKVTRQPCETRTLHSSAGRPCRRCSRLVGRDRDLGGPGHPARTGSLAAAAHAPDPRLWHRCGSRSIAPREAPYRQIQNYNKTCHGFRSPKRSRQRSLVPVLASNHLMRRTAGRRACIGWAVQIGQVAGRVDVRGALASQSIFRFSLTTRHTAQAAAAVVASR